jgi:hypothetical protein
MRLEKKVSGNLSIIRRYRKAQAMLLKGCTVADLMEALSLSDKSVRSLIKDFRTDGCTVESSFILGTQDAARLSTGVVKLTRLADDDGSGPNNENR